MGVVKKNLYVHHIPIFSQNLYISVGRDAATKYFGSVAEMPENMVGGSTSFIHEGKRIFLMVIDDLDINTTMHECVHVAMDIYHYIDLYYGPDNQEPLAYLVGYIAEGVDQIVTSHKEKDMDK